jgi:hypothetical protein
VAVSFIGGGNQSTWRKPPTCRFIKLYTYNICPGNTQGGKGRLELKKPNDINDYLQKYFPCSKIINEKI